MERVGILGGTFDPIHLGHFGVAEGAMEALDLRRIIFVPADTPPHKLDGRPITAYAHRYQMVAEAIAPYPRYEISDIEHSRGGKSYTYDTVTQLQRLMPQAELYFLTGADSVEELTTWYRWQGILDACYVVGMSRSGYKLQLNEQLALQNAKSAKGLILLDIQPLAISATEIRACYHRGGHWCSQLVPIPVADYIREKQLYQ